MLKIDDVKLYEALSEESKKILEEVIYCSKRLGIAPDDLLEAIKEYDSKGQG